MQRITRKDLERAVEALNDYFHKENLLHAESNYVVQSRNGHMCVDLTGGPIYGTGQSSLIIATTRECVEAVWAIRRAALLNSSSFPEKGGFAL